MDRRQIKTRQAIFRAFSDLLRRKPFPKISVQEIIDEANVGRSTFYAHFETKDDLLRGLCVQIFEHVFSEELMSEKTHDFSGRKKSLPDEITHILYHLQDQREVIGSILFCDRGEVFTDTLKEYLWQMFDSALVAGGGEIPRDYMLHHMVCDFAETVRWWIGNDSYTPEQVARFYLSTTPFVS